MKRATAIVWRKRWHRYPRVTSARLLSAAFNLATGLRLLLPDDILGTVPGYRLMAVHFRGDVIFGLALIAYGLVMAWSLFTDRFGPLVVAATWLSLITWVVVAIDIGAVNPSQIGTLAYCLIAAMNGYAYAHLVAWRRQNG